MSLHGFSQEFQGGSFISGLRDKGFENLAFMVDRAPKIMCFARDSHEDLVEMPAPLPGLTHGACASLADRFREEFAKSIDPEPDALVADVDTAFMEQVFDVAK